MNVLGGDVRSFAERRIIARENIPPPVIEPVGVVRAAKDAIPHVVDGKEPIVPLRGRAVLLPLRDEAAAFLDERFERFGDEEFKIGFAPPLVVVDGQKVFA